MLKYIFNRYMIKMSKRYRYDIAYMQDILKADLSAFLKYLASQFMASYTGNLPAEVIFAAKLRTIIKDDCGPCTQLITNMALEANVSSEHVQHIIERNINDLPNDVALIVQFTDLVLAHDVEADSLRDKIIALWGEKGLVAISFSISSTRVYPALKYALGHGKTCSKISVNESVLKPIYYERQ